MSNLWQDLKKPIICLAPMDGVTDMAFRQLLVSIGKPDIMFTEFVNVNAIFSHDTKSSTTRLDYEDLEKPLVAQIWGTVPELFQSSAKLVTDLGFDGVDINMGCPDKNVIKKGAGSALINNLPLAKEIILATKKGANKKIPVSVKIRLGFKQIKTEEWVNFLLNLDIDALIIHGRTTKEMSKVPAHWDEIKKAVDIRDKLKKETLIIGNGDVFSREDALDKVKKFGVDGVMVGRGVFQDPYAFNPNESLKTKSPQEKIDLLKTHLNLYVKTWGDKKPFHPLKRFFKVYINDFDHALDLRVKLMETNSKQEVLEVLKNFK